MPPLNVNRFLTRLNEIDPNSVILKVVQPFAAAHVKKSFNNLPIPLTELYDPINAQLSLLTLQEKPINLSISEEQQISIENATNKQSKSKDWIPMRAGKITASNFKGACKTNLDNPSLTLIKDICYPSKKRSKVSPLIYGIKSEPKARNVYVKYIKDKHSNFKLELSGLIVSIENPNLGASPDGLISCDCCGDGCLEIKCPFTLREPSDENKKKYLDSKECPLIDLGNKHYAK